MLNSEDHMSECSISISPNLGQLKSAIDASPSFIKPNLANIKDVLNHQIRVFLKNEGDSSASLIAIGPPMLNSNPIGGGSIMKKREMNELSNSVFKQKMKQTMMLNIFCGSGMFVSSYVSLGNFSNEGDATSRIKSRVEMIKSYQRISENEVLIRSLDEIESLAMEIQEKGHNMGKNRGK